MACSLLLPYLYLSALMLIKSPCSQLLLCGDMKKKIHTCRICGTQSLRQSEQSIYFFCLLTLFFLFWSSLNLPWRIPSNWSQDCDSDPFCFIPITVRFTSQETVLTHSTLYFWHILHNPNTSQVCFASASLIFRKEYQHHLS